MLQYLHSSAKNQQIKPLERLRAGSWVRCERPNEDELAELLSLGLDNDLLSDALDPHEVPRLEIGDDWTYLIARLPDTDDDFNDFTTPILFCLNKNYAVTLSRDSLGRLWQPFIDQARSRTDRPVEFCADTGIEAFKRMHQKIDIIRIGSRIQMTVRGVIISTPASDARRSIRILSAVIIMIGKRRTLGIFDRKIIERVIAVVPARKRAPVDHAVDGEHADVYAGLQRIDKAVIFCTLRAQRPAESRPQRIFHSGALQHLSLRSRTHHAENGKNNT